MAVPEWFSFVVEVVLGVVYKIGLGFLVGDFRGELSQLLLSAKIEVGIGFRQPFA